MIFGGEVKLEWLIKNYSLNRQDNSIKSMYDFEPNGDNIIEALTPLVKLGKRSQEKSHFDFLVLEPCFNKPSYCGIFYNRQKVGFMTFKPHKYENFLEEDLELNSENIESTELENSMEPGDSSVWYKYNNIVEGLSIVGELIKHKNGEIPYELGYGNEDGHYHGNGFFKEFEEFKYFREMEEFWEHETLSELQESKKEILKKISLVFSLDYKEEEIIEEIKDFKENERSILNEKYERTPEVFDNFIEKYGAGKPSDREKLSKLLEKKNVKLGKTEIRLICRLKWKEKQEAELKSYLNSGEGDRLSRFMKKYDVGDLKSRKHLAQIMDKPTIEVEKILKQRQMKQEEENELKEFERELFSNKGVKDPLEELESLEWDWEDIMQMDGLEFERVLSEIFEKLGYEAKVTQGSGDQGADLVLNKDGEKTVVQAKRYSSNVSNSAVQEVVASKKHYNAEKGIVVTTSNFTNSAESLARSNDIKLWNGSKLRKELNKI